MSSANPVSFTIPLWLQGLAWLAGLGLCVYGLFDGVAMWSFGYAFVMLLILTVAPLCWNWPSRKRLRPWPETPPVSTGRRIVHLVVLGGISLGMSVWTARQFGDYPPAYHDEFSYLFQAKTFLAGRLWFPSHPMHPELFDQMHVLNDDGRMTSRYFPGTGLWMAPFVAVNHPYLGHWICSVLATAFVYLTGCELRNSRTGLFAGLLTALSPGMALFDNLLLAHQPTLLGLSFFLWMMTRLMRTEQGSDAFGAGIGLTWAMLCRPMTAAGFGLPFGIWTAVWLLRSSAPIRSRVRVLLSFAVPISLGIAVQLGYNAAITGSPWSSPYQLYTDIYTPRHVYGFNNVIRGEERLSPKVIEGYDKWAENLTPELAAKNLNVRLVNSLLLTWDVLPLGMIAVLWLGLFPKLDWRCRLPGLAIASLHAAHVPYWFAGIMGWHYVFESLILWTLLAGAMIDLLLISWRQSGKTRMAGWLTVFCLATVAGNLITIPGVWKAKLGDSVSSIRYSRRKQAEFREWVSAVVKHEPSLILVGPHHDQGHLDYVINDPGLDAPILFGRYLPGKTDPAEIARDFPDRAVFLCDPDKHSLRRVKP